MKFSILVISLCLVTYVTIDSSVAQSQENTSYNATITRDIWGVPHIHGDRDRDAAFGLAYAHAEDDIKNIAPSAPNVQILVHLKHYLLDHQALNN